MSLNSGKHKEKEIAGVRCRIVEQDIPKERVDFLKPLLETNGLVVHFEEMAKKEETDPTVFIIGITDVTFNPTLAVYKQALKTADGRTVTPAFWKQETNTVNTIQYWE